MCHMCDSVNTDNLTILIVKISETSAQLSPKRQNSLLWFQLICEINKTKFNIPYLIFYLLFADIANAWLETLLDVIDLLPKEVIKKDVSLKNSITAFVSDTCNYQT